MPMLTDFMNIAPITYRQTGQISSPQGSCLYTSWTVVSMILGRMTVAFKISA